MTEWSGSRPELRIGISGWNYAGWRGVFYPPDLPRRKELEDASRQVGSIEISGSFYSLQTPPSYRRWHEQTPPGFAFALEGSRFITHMKKLADVRVPLAGFFASGVVLLRERLGPMLAPRLARRLRLARYRAALTGGVRVAAALARTARPWQPSRACSGSDPFSLWRINDPR